jgi:metal-responsive CopG/Arc/MetJ family transcriptional regulator
MHSLKSGRLPDRNPSKTVSIHIPRLILALIDQEARDTGKSRSEILKPILRYGLLQYSQIYSLSAKAAKELASSEAIASQTPKAD